MLGWVGPKDLGFTSTHEAVLTLAHGLSQTSRHILGCFVFDTHHDVSELVKIATNRAIAHLNNALQLVFDDGMTAVSSSIGDHKGEFNAVILHSND